MAKPMDHDDVMELAVQLTCSYLGTSHSGDTNAEDLIHSYYQQIRNVEARLGREQGIRSDEGKDAERAAV